MTANSKHTPGPWKVEPFVQSINGYPDWHSFTVRHDRTNVHIATVGDVDRYYEKDNEANARLIAAAPETAAERDYLREVNAELLAALVGLLTSVESMIVDDNVPVYSGDKARINAAPAGSVVTGRR